ncbi:MAG: hypothetical protein CL609_06880 [Anaerolineaceae bacterium]|nr:hypothetical protein [Anaerolineaceae bacterium]
MPILDPNLAYVLLVGGFILSVLALLTPGTGVVEIGGLFALVLAGYGIISSPTNYWALVFLIPVLPFLFLYRKSKKNYWLVLLILFLNIGSFAIFKSEDQYFSVSPVLAIIVTIIDTILLWFVIKKLIEAIDQKPAFDPQSIIGKIGEARTRISGEGTVYVDGEEWSARSSQVIPKEAKIRVINKNGLILDVLLLEQEEEGV